MNPENSNRIYMLTYMLELWWNTARIAIETKEQLQLLPNLQHRAENVITFRKKEKKKITVWFF